MYPVDSSDGRAEDCRVCNTTNILRSLVQFRLDGNLFWSFLIRVEVILRYNIL